MKAPYRRILFALVGSIVFHIIAMVAGMGDIFILPIGVMFFFDILDLWPSVDPLWIILATAVLSYAIVFWLVATIWSMSVELVGRHR